jgi:hypothetical protein
MKKIFLIVLLFIAANTFAQDSTKTKTHAHKQKGKEVAKELGLNKQQAKELKQSKKTAKGEIDAVKNDDKLTGKEKKEKMKAIKEREKENAKKVLTPEQQEKMKVLQEKRKAEHHKKKE